MNNIGFILQRLENAPTDKIMSLYQDSLKIKKQILGTNHLSVGTTLTNIGSVYHKNGNNKKAMKAYQKALEIIIIHNNINNNDNNNLVATTTTTTTNYQLNIATIHSNIGDIYLATDQLVAARINYHRALEIRWLELGDTNITDTRVIRLLERIARIDMSDVTQKLREEPECIYDIKYNKDYYYYYPNNKNKDNNNNVNNDESIMFVEETEENLRLEMLCDQIEMNNEIRNIFS
mmetsp:Transcript_24680/g.27252  ORF Transcript_24680/g.27252 Transcript_24680/m.27252 type:complete len:234 (+) Transcript_24680:331-1032(+)